MLTLILFLSTILAAATPAHAEGVAATPEDVGSENPFHKSYVGFELARNYPVSFSQNRYEPGPYHPVIEYRHNLDHVWMMGVGGQFKILRRIDLADEDEPSAELCLWTVTHEALYILRLDHPTYLFVGPKMHYLLPALSAKLPVARDDALLTEIGVAASVTLARMLPSGGLVTLRADRWRGTRTLSLHGVEVAFGLSLPLR